MHVWMLLGLIHKTPSDGWRFSTFPPPSLENTDHFKCWVQSNTLDLEHRTQTHKSYLGGDTTPASPTFFLVGFMVTPWHPSSTPTTSWPFEELQPLILLSASAAQQEVTPLPLNPSLTSSDLPPSLTYLHCLFTLLPESSSPSHQWFSPVPTHAFSANTVRF